MIKIIATQEEKQQLIIANTIEDMPDLQIGALIGGRLYTKNDRGDIVLEEDTPTSNMLLSLGNELTTLMSDPVRGYYTRAAEEFRSTFANWDQRVVKWGGSYMVLNPDQIKQIKLAHIDWTEKYSALLTSNASSKKNSKLADESIAVRLATGKDIKNSMAQAVFQSISTIATSGSGFSLSSMGPVMMSYVIGPRLSAKLESVFNKAVIDIDFIEIKSPVDLQILVEMITSRKVEMTSKEQKAIMTKFYQDIGTKFGMDRIMAGDVSKKTSFGAKRKGKKTKVKAGSRAKNPMDRLDLKEGI